MVTQQFKGAGALAAYYSWKSSVLINNVINVLLNENVCMSLFLSVSLSLYIYIYI